MKGRGNRHLSLAMVILAIGALSPSAPAQEKSSGAGEQIDLKSVWKKFTEVNRVWLDPQPQSLSYKITSGSPPPAEPETTQLVWISGNKARWEMETKLDAKRLDYTLVITPERSEYLRGPESLLGKNVGRRSLGALRQSFSWYSAVHSLYQHGLPDDATIVSETRDGDDRLIVVQATPDGRAFVGLGLDHLYYGSSQRPFGQTKLTLRLPDHTLVREEFADGTVIECGPEYVKAGSGLAPQSMRHIAKTAKSDTWILAADFQVVNNVWLLKSAKNIQGQTVVKQMDVHDVSTQPVADEKFATITKNANGRLQRVLVFSGTGWFRHPQIPASNGWLVRLGAEYDVQVDVTETPSDITPERLLQYQVFLLNNANELDKVLDEKQRTAIEKWYQQGGGIVGLHAALVHQQGWPWFNELAGCDFNSDSTFVRARVVVDPQAKDNPLIQGQGNEFWYQADWHNHDKSVTGLPGVRVLLRLDESTFEPVQDYFKTRGGKPMGADHPMTWTREHDGGRFFYTELGHDVRSLDTPFGKKLLIEALRWTANLDK